MSDKISMTILQGMSVERLITYSAAKRHSEAQNAQETSNLPPPPHGINVVLGGAMLSGMIIMLFVICYCCHKNQQKREAHLNPYWRDQTILSSEIFTVDGAQLIEVAEFQIEESNPSSPGPPPPYETVVDQVPPYESVVNVEREAMENENANQPRRKSRRWSFPQAVVAPLEDSEPPSYEEAIKLQSGQHI